MKGTKAIYRQRHDHIELHPTSESYSDDTLTSSQPSHQTDSSDDTDTDDDSIRESWRRHYEEEDLWQLRPHLPILAQISKDLYTPVSREERDVLQEFSKHKTYHLLHGKWDIDRDTAQFLASAASPSADERATYQPKFMLHRMRLEEPVLCVDPQSELIELQHRNLPYLTPSDEIPFTLQTDEDESLQWSSKSWKAFSDMKHDISHGRLPMNKETAEFMKDVVTSMQDNRVKPEPRFKVSPQIPEILENRSDNMSQLEALKISPTILPLSSPRSLPVLSSPLAAIEFASTPEDLLAKEAADMHKKIMQDDDFDGDDLLLEENEEKVENVEMPDRELDGYLAQIAQNGVDVILQTPEKERITPESKRANDIIAYLEQLGEDSMQVVPSSPISRKTKRLRDLRLESPLLLEDHEEPAGKKSKLSFTHGDFISILDESTLPQMHELSDTLDKEAEAKLSQALTPYAQAANAALAKERLHELDTILRVHVPSLPADPTPVPPWQLSANIGEDPDRPVRLLDAFQDIERSLLVNERRWGGLSKLDRLLPWTSFPSRLGKVQPEGDFDDGSLARYLDELALDEVTGLEGFIWKPDGFRVLDPDEDDDDELMMHGQDVGDDLQPESENMPPSEVAIAQPSELEDTTEVFLETLPAPNLKHDEIDFTDILSSKKKSLMEFALPGSEIHSQAQEDNHSCNTSLVKFLQLQGESMSEPRKDISQLFAFKAPRIVVARSEHVATKDLSAELSLPALDRPDRHFNGIMTHTLMADWMLLRTLQSHLPNFDFIERSSPMASTITDNGNVHALRELEADLTISASTGIILTSLQKIKQKPLPGQEKTFHGMQERLADVASRYDRLVVLVGESGDGSLQSLDDRDSAALVEIMRLNESLLPMELIVRYIPGGQAILVHWIAALICRYGRCSDHAPDDKQQQQANITTPCDTEPPNTTTLDDPHVTPHEHDNLRSSSPPPSPSLLLPDETFWERFLRAAGMNAFAAQRVLGQLKRWAESGKRHQGTEAETSDRTLEFGRKQEAIGLAAFIRMRPEEREREFGGMFTLSSSSFMGGRGSLLARVGRVIDGDERRDAKGGYWQAGTVKMRVFQ
jgi:hypothetical protein